MHTGAITSYIDVAQLALYAFWIFFAGLIYYLRSEDKREGYPLESDRPGRRGIIQGFPPMPKPKTFLMQHGGIRVVPDGRRELHSQPAIPVDAAPGAALQPTGDPMIDSVGPAAYAMRSETPDMTYEGHHRIVPLRLAPGFSIESKDPDPRGMEVRGADGGVAGVVRDVWVDRSETVLRYLEVDITGLNAPKTVLLPINFTRISRRPARVSVKSITAAQFANVPSLNRPDEVTLREEDHIMAYYASGHLYATPSRMGPLL